MILNPSGIRGRDAPGENHSVSGTHAPSPCNLDTSYIRCKKQEESTLALPVISCKTRNKRIGHFYNALKSGMIWNKNKPLCHLVLSSPPGARDITISFNHLRLEIGRLTVGYLKNNGLLTPYQVKRFYKDRSDDSPIQFEYLAMKTSEGNGVYHIIFAGDYLPVDWLHSNWTRIHGAGTGRTKRISIWIRYLRNQGDYDRIQQYVMGHYLADQDKYVNHSQSRGWLFPGYRKYFKMFIREFGYELGISYWDDCLDRRIPPIEYLGKYDEDIGFQRRPYGEKPWRLSNFVR